MQLAKGKVLIKISAAEKDKIFNSMVETEKGMATLFLQNEESSDMAGYYEQSVQSGEVIAVADDVEHIKVGDIAILDYMADAMNEIVVYQDDNGKIICITAMTRYHEDDLMTYQSATSRVDAYVWRKGDIDEASMIYGVYRDGILIPNPPYLVCEHLDFVIRSTSKEGYEYQHEPSGCVIRRLIAPNPTSDPMLKAGSMVVVDRFCLYERIMDGKSLDIIMDRDIELLMETN